LQGIDTPGGIEEAERYYRDLPSTKPISVSMRLVISRVISAGPGEQYFIYLPEELRENDTLLSMTYRQNCQESYKREFFYYFNCRMVQP